MRNAGALGSPLRVSRRFVFATGGRVGRVRAWGELAAAVGGDAHAWWVLTLPGALSSPLPPSPLLLHLHSLSAVHEKRKRRSKARPARSTLHPPAPHGVAAAPTAAPSSPRPPAATPTTPQPAATPTPMPTPPLCAVVRWSWAPQAGMGARRKTGGRVAAARHKARGLRLPTHPF